MVAVGFSFACTVSEIGFSRQKAFWGFYGENGFLTTINKAKNRLGDKKEVKPSSPLSNFCNKH